MWWGKERLFVCFLLSFFFFVVDFCFNKTEEFLIFIPLSYTPLPLKDFHSTILLLLSFLFSIHRPVFLVHYISLTPSIWQIPYLTFRQMKLGRNKCLNVHQRWVKLVFFLLGSLNFPQDVEVFLHLISAFGQSWRYLLRIPLQNLRSHHQIPYHAIFQGIEHVNRTLLWCLFNRVLQIG